MPSQAEFYLGIQDTVDSMNDGLHRHQEGGKACLEVL